MGQVSRPGLVELRVSEGCHQKCEPLVVVPSGNGPGRDLPPQVLAEFSSCGCRTVGFRFLLADCQRPPLAPRNGPQSLAIWANPQGQPEPWQLAFSKPVGECGIPAKWALCDLT